MAKSILVPFLLIVILVTYFPLSQGIVFKLLNKNSSELLTIPYSYSLSSNINFVGRYTSGDIDCCKWVLANHGSLPIVSDYTGSLLLYSYMLDSIVGLASLDRGIPSYSCYVFIPSWELEKGRLTFGKAPGVRWTTSIPEEVYSLDIVYSSRGSVVYRIKEV